MSRQPVNPASLPRVGQPFEGGFYAGRIYFDGQEHALVDAGRDHELAAAWWDKEGPRPNIRGACSCHDGRANTRAMAEAGSTIAAQVLAMSIRGFDDWHLPALEELQLMRANLCQLPKWEVWYAHQGPGGPEQAFCHSEYWSSTQRTAGGAWAVTMRNWNNSCSNWGFKVKGIRPIRSVPIKPFEFVHEPAGDGRDQGAGARPGNRDAVVAVVERFVNEDSGRFYGRATELVDALVGIGEQRHA